MGSDSCFNKTSCRIECCSCYIMFYKRWSTNIDFKCISCYSYNWQPLIKWWVCRSWILLISCITIHCTCECNAIFCKLNIITNRESMISNSNSHNTCWCLIWCSWCCMLRSTTKVMISNTHCHRTSTRVICHWWWVMWNSRWLTNINCNITSLYF